MFVGIAQGGRADSTHDCGLISWRVWEVWIDREHIGDPLRDCVWLVGNGINWLSNCTHVRTAHNENEKCRTSRSEI